MGPWMYYSPLWAGTLVAALLYSVNISSFTNWPTWLQVVIVAISSPIVGLQLQVIMIGMQGAFAEVLPVPRGRSIRGRAAIAVGYLILAGVIFSVCGWALITLAVLIIPGIVLAVISSLSWVGALVVYLWYLPAAVQDF